MSTCRVCCELRDVCAHCELSLCTCVHVCVPCELCVCTCLYAYCELCVQYLSCVMSARVCVHVR